MLENREEILVNNVKKLRMYTLLEIFGIIQDAKKAMKNYWLNILHLINVWFQLPVSWLRRFVSYTIKQYSYGADGSTVTNSVSNLGSITGGLILSHLSTFIDC